MHLVERLAERFEAFCVETLASNDLHGEGLVRIFRWPREEGPFAGAWVHYEIKLDGVFPLVPWAEMFTMWDEGLEEHEGEEALFAFNRLEIDPRTGDEIPTGWATANAIVPYEIAQVQARLIIGDWNDDISTAGSRGKAWNGAWLEVHLRGGPERMLKGRRFKSIPRGTSKPKRGTRSSRAPSSSLAAKRKPSRGGKKRRS